MSCNAKLVLRKGGRPIPEKTRLEWVRRVAAREITVADLAREVHRPYQTVWKIVHATYAKHHEKIPEHYKTDCDFNRKSMLRVMQAIDRCTKQKAKAAEREDLDSYLFWAKARWRARQDLNLCQQIASV